MQEYDVIVVGAGSGLTLAYLAEQAGKSVAIVDEDGLGGTCLNRGCIPTKNLIEAAQIVHNIRRGPKYGIEVDPAAIKIDFGRTMERMRRLRQEGVAGTQEWVESTEGFTWFRGRGRFVGDRTLEVNGQTLRAELVFLAAGARPAVPPIPGLEEAGYLTNASVMELTVQPRSLAVLGGGYIGCELAYFFSMLGSEVTVVESKHCLLREDHDVRQLFTAELANYVKLHNGYRALKVEVREGEKVMTIHPNDHPDQTLEVIVDEILVATGRRPNTDTLNLDQTGVDTNRFGYVVVDDYLCTSNPHIWAFGDIIGQGMFKHTASREAHAVWANSQGARQKFSYRTNPHAIFSYPQIAGVGLTEEEAREQGLDFRVLKVDYDDVAKGEIVGSPPGFAKALVENNTEKILGFHMVGPGSADLVAEVVVAMNCGEGTLANITNSIHIHPTLPELIEYLFQTV